MSRDRKYREEKDVLHGEGRQNKGHEMSSTWRMRAARKTECLEESLESSEMRFGGRQEPDHV